MDVKFPPSTSGAARKAAVTFRGTVEKTIYHNEENGYCVLAVSPDAQSVLEGTVDGDNVVCVGYILKVEESMRLAFSGSFVENPRYGKQFKFSSAIEEFQSDEHSIELYLASGVIDKVGPALAHRIVKKFGADTADVLTNHPERLCEVKGIGEETAEVIKQSWDEKNHLRNLMEFLQTYSISVNTGMAIYKVYGERSLPVVQANPYVLMEEVKGIGFAKGDDIALKIGIDKKAPIRIEAGVLAALSNATSDGHVFLLKDDLVPQAMQLLGEESKELIEEAICALSRSGKIVVEEMEERPAKGEKKQIAVYRKGLHVCESKIAFYLNRILETPPSAKVVSPEEDVQHIVLTYEHRLDETQIQALKAASKHKMMVVTGGPGTGKTTIINLIIKLFGSVTNNILLAAPTGRAAKRMSEATDKEASTIHRLLGYNGKFFAKDEDDLISCDLLIVDEASMMDVSLFYHLLKALPSTVTLILVGDVHQLPSVGPGSVLSDIIQSGRVPVSELKKIYRQKARGKGQSDIVEASQLVNDGKMPKLSHGDGYEADFFFIPAGTPEAAAKIIIALVQQRLPNYYKYDPIEDIQVLCPMHKGIVGAENLNRSLQEALNASCLRKEEEIDDDVPWTVPAEMQKPAPAQAKPIPFRLGDKVMQTKNNYDADVFNGDIGRVIDVDEGERTITVEFDETKLVIYSAPPRSSYADMGELVLAYAISIHKSQGSEYKAVVIPLLMQHYIMLQRNLVYTAISRGKEIVVIVGQQQALKRAVDNNIVTQRNSRLLWRLTHPGGLEAPQLDKMSELDAESISF